MSKEKEMLEAKVREAEKRAKEAEEKALAADIRAEEIGKTIWDAILQAVQKGLQEDERARTVHRVMRKRHDAHINGERVRLTKQEREALVQEMQKRDLLELAAEEMQKRDLLRLAAKTSRPSQQRLSSGRQPRLLNGPKP